METVCKFHRVTREQIRSTILATGLKPEFEVKAHCLHPEGFDVPRCIGGGGDICCKGDPKACFISPTAPFERC